MNDGITKTELELGQMVVERAESGRTVVRNGDGGEEKLRQRNLQRNLRPLHPSLLNSHQSKNYTHSETFFHILSRE